MVMSIENDVLEFNTKSLKFLIIVNEHHIMADDNCMPYIIYEKQNEAMRKSSLFTLCVYFSKAYGFYVPHYFPQNMSNTMKHCFVAMINYKINHCNTKMSAKISNHSSAKTTCDNILFNCFSVNEQQWVVIIIPSNYLTYG